jgi:hypothetical protein
MPCSRAARFDARADELRPDAVALHAREEVRVIVAAAADVLHHVHHLVGAIGVVRGEPRTEQRRDLEGQAHQYIGGADRAGFGCGRHDRFDLVIGDRGDDRRDIDLRRHARVDQLADCGEAAAGMRCARLERPGDGGIEGGDRHRDADQMVARHVGEQVDVAQNPVGLGRDDQRVARFGEDLDHRPRDAPFALDRLVTVGVRADRERSGRVAAFREFGAQQSCGIGFGEQPAFEIEPRRQVVEGVRRSGKAIDAAMLAAAIGVDRTVEADVGRLVA